MPRGQSKPQSSSVSRQVDLRDKPCPYCDAYHKVGDIKGDVYCGQCGRYLGEANDNFVPFAQAARSISEQTQYAARYHTGVNQTRVLTDGLRVTPPGLGGDYHQIKIHKDDIKEFKRRVEEQTLRSK